MYLAVTKQQLFNKKLLKTIKGKQRTKSISMIIIKGTSLNKSKLWKSLAEINYPLYKKNKKLKKLTKMSLVFYFKSSQKSSLSLSHSKMLPGAALIDPYMMMLLIVLALLFWFWLCFVSYILCISVLVFSVFILALFDLIILKSDQRW